MAFAQDDNRLSAYRKLLVELPSDLSGSDLETLKLAAVDFIPRGTTENIGKGLKFFDVLEQDGRIAPQDLSLLEDMFKTIGRMDLAWKIECFATSQAKNNIDHEIVNQNAGINNADAGIEDVVGDGGGGIEPGSDRAASDSRMMELGMESMGKYTDIDDVVTDGGGDETENDRAGAGDPRIQDDMESQDESQVVHVGAMTRTAPLCNQTLLYNAPDIHGSDSDRGSSIATGGHTPAPVPTCAPAAPAPAPAPAAPAPVLAAAVSCSQTLAGQQSRLQHDSSVGPTPVRYVNYLACEGYSVEIIGGKHFKTPEGEFVEMKSGRQYQIHVKNSRTYGCNLDMSIDGYDVGGWVVDGGQELTIERPAYEARKFTFYRVKTAPKEAGIEAGRSENGVVKCVFTPEAFLDIAVGIPGLSQPLEVNIDPSATVGDLKHKVHSQLKATSDPSQILVLNDEVLSNFTLLSEVVTSPGNLRLIDVELEVTVEVSSNVIFAVKMHTSKAKVHDLMEQIQRKLDVPIKDQKLYHGRACLSDAPQRGLPQALICSLQPTVVVILPEYIDITVEDMSSGEKCTVKIDKTKTPRDVVAEIPLCRKLPKNKAVMLYFNGKEVCPSKDEKTLTSLGICCGSKLELKRVKEKNEAAPSKEETKDVPSEEGQNSSEEDEDYEAIFEAQGPTPDEAGFPTRLSAPPDYASRCATRCDHMNTYDEDELNQKGEPTRLNRKARPLPPGKIVGYVEPSGREQAEPSGREQAEPPALPTRSPVDEAIYYHAPALPPARPSGWMDAEKATRFERREQHSHVLTKNDPAWKAGGTTLQGYSTQQFIAADPIKVDHSKKIELVLRLVAREDETDLIFPKDEFKPLSTLYPPAVPE